MVISKRKFLTAIVASMVHLEETETEALRRKGEKVLTNNPKAFIKKLRFSFVSDLNEIPEGTIQ